MHRRPKVVREGSCESEGGLEMKVSRGPRTNFICFPTLLGMLVRDLPQAHSEQLKRTNHYLASEHSGQIFRDAQA